MTEMKRYSVGIDLGTSNTVLAYAAAGSQEIRVFEIDQLVSLGEVAARPLLPSVRYHAAPGELSAGKYRGARLTVRLVARVEVSRISRW
jgi:molecular chaperone DnaK (HSP70)